SGRYAARGMGASFLSNRWWAASMSSQQQIQAKHELLRPFLKGRLRRLWAAAEALEIGPAGIKRVAEAIGMSTTTVKLGMRELRGTGEAQPAKTKTEDESRRRTGRPRCDEKDPGLIGALERLLHDETAGDPTGQKKWVRSSLRRLSARLKAEG